jgi:phytoene dehydrogenase-like protein
VTRVEGRPEAVVVGGGHNGLVCAAYLARAGIGTVVLERGDEVGGVSRTIQVAPGFRAPALLHTAEGLRRSIVRDLRLEEHGLGFIRPDVVAFAPEPDGRGVPLFRDPNRTAEWLRRRVPADADGFVAFDRRVRSVASFLAHVAASTPPDIEAPSIADAIAGLRLVRALRRLGPRALRETLRVVPMPVADLVGDAVDDELLRGALASRGVALTAMGPWTPGTACVFLMNSVTGGGGAGDTVYVRGGPGALSTALEQAARRLGAEVRTGAEVAAVRTTGGRAAGVVLTSGEEIAARVVVSALDPKRTLGLVDPVVLGPTLLWRGKNIRTPGAVAKVNLALSEAPPFRADDPALLQGRVVVGPSIEYLERAADDHKYGRSSEAPFLELTIPSLTDGTLVNGDGHVVSVLYHYVPYSSNDGRRGAKPDATARDDVLKTVLGTLDTYAPGLSDRVLAHQVLLPSDLEREFCLSQGCIQHAEPGLDQFFAWRPLLGHARYRFGAPGLYLAGAGAHPGGGITGAPGAGAAREVLADLRGKGSPAPPAPVGSAT